jgi:hypothetical protein
MNTAALAEMLERDRAEWARLTALLDAHPDAVIHEPGSPPWTARDVYSHFTRWINHSTDDFEANLAGRTLARPQGTDDEINARWQAEDASLSLEEARQRAHAALERRVAAIEGAPPDAWTPALDAIALADGHQHIKAHRRYVGAAIGEG